MYACYRSINTYMPVIIIASQTGRSPFIIVLWHYTLRKGTIIYSETILDSRLDSALPFHPRKRCLTCLEAGRATSRLSP